MRGEGSLQQLLGRSTFTGKKRKAPNDAPTTDSSAATVSRVESPLKQGCVRCPICKRQLPHQEGDEFINEHIDKCLFKTRANTAKQQSTLIAFAQRTDSILARPPKQEEQQREQQQEEEPSNAEPAAVEENPSLAGQQSPTAATFSNRTGSASPWPSSNSEEERASQQLPLATSTSVLTPLCFPSLIVGRQFQKRLFLSSGARLRAGMRLEIQAEVENLRDRNALLAVLQLSSDDGGGAAGGSSSSAAGAGGVPIGHLPAAVARHLSPLLRRGLAAAEAVVVELPPSLGDRAPLPVEVQISVIPASAAAIPRKLSERAAAEAVQAAARAAAAAAGEKRTSGDLLRRNFQVVMTTVQQHDAVVLEGEELTFMRTYSGLSAPAQCLFLRLSLRCGPLFRLTALDYPDVPDAGAAAAELSLVRLAAWESADSSSSSGGGCLFNWTELTSTLTVPELQSVLSRLFVLRQTQTSSSGSCGAALSRTLGGQTRAAVLAALRTLEQPSGPAASRAAVRRELLSAAGPVVQLLPGALTALQRIQRLFFLDEGQSLSQFLAADSGAVRYPTFTITRSLPAFPTRAHLLQYEAALAQAEALAAALEDGDEDAAHASLAPAWAALDAGRHKSGGAEEGDARPLFLRKNDAAWVFCLMATTGVSLLERQKRYREAADRLQQLLGGWCCPSRRGLWWARLSTDLEHLGRPMAALEIAEAALADELLGPGDLLCLRRRVLRLGKPPRRWKVPPWAQQAQREPREVCIEGRPLDKILGVKSRFYGYDDQECSVEELALQYYASSEGGGFQGIHSEGSIWATLFGLLLWPALFGAPVTDTFRSPFQTAPLDLDSEGFYAARANVIEACLAEIAGGAAPDVLAASWAEHRGTMARGVNWDRWNLPELQEIASCIGGGGLAAVFRLMAQDHAGWQGGMPDLLLWHPERKEAKLSEVKGPRDRLSDQQRAWIAALEDAGLRVEVLKVAEPPQGRVNGGKGNKGKGRKRR